MFGNKVDDATKDKILTIISDDVVIEGSVIAKKAIRVDGVINGAVRTKESVIVGARAAVRGGIKASNVMAAGEVYGGIEAPNGKIEISDTGKVFGDLIAGRLVIDENAVFQGNCTMTGKNAKPSKEAIEVPADIEETASAASGAGQTVPADAQQESAGEKQNGTESN